MKFLISIGLMVSLAVITPVSFAAPDVELNQISGNHSLHPDFVVTATASLDDSGQVITVMNTRGKVLLRVLGTATSFEVLFPTNNEENTNESGATPDWLEIPQAALDTVEDDTTTVKLISVFGDIRVYAVYNNGVLIGFFIVNTVTGETIFSKAT